MEAFTEPIISRTKVTATIAEGAEARRPGSELGRDEPLLQKAMYGFDVLVVFVLYTSLKYLSSFLPHPLPPELLPPPPAKVKGHPESGGREGC